MCLCALVVKSRILLVLRRLSLRERIQTENAPAAIGPYSQAIKAGGFVFVLGADPDRSADWSVRCGGIAEQTERVLKNLQAVLEAAGSSLGQVVKTTVFLADMKEFSGMNEVYATFFPEPPPRGLRLLPLVCRAMPGLKLRQ